MAKCGFCDREGLHNGPDGLEKHKPGYLGRVGNMSNDCQGYSTYLSRNAEQENRPTVAQIR